MPRESISARLTVEMPGDHAGETIKAIDWYGVTEGLKKNPNVWMRLHHNYASDRAVRTSVAKAALRHGFKYQVTKLKPQEDGKHGVFVMWHGDRRTQGKGD